MNLEIILTYAFGSHLYRRPKQTSIGGLWLDNLAKQYNGATTLLGLDDKKRVEVQISVNLFLKLKSDPLFIQKAVDLRRVRTIRTGKSTWVLEAICFPIAEFDNDLDSSGTIADYQQIAEQTVELAKSKKNGTK